MDVIGLKRGTVRVIPYQSEWKQLFEDEASRLRVTLGEPDLRVEHVGSTAIEGMYSKPIIDILVAVRRLSGARPLASMIQALGYEYKRDDDVEGRMFFVKGPSSSRTHHLSLAEPGSEYWDNHMLFRDYLMAHPEAADEYRQLKQGLAEQFPEDRDSYTEGKREFVERILGLARQGK